jgi:hypothetical protein
MTTVTPKSVTKIGLPTIGFFGSVVGLMVNLPRVISNPGARIAFGVVILLMLLWLGWAVYDSLIHRLRLVKDELGNIKSLVSSFISNHQGPAFTDQIDLNLINLLTTTRSLRSMVAGVREIKVLSPNQMEVVIDKGYSDGLVSGMEFKVLHSDQLEELGVCRCTPGHDDASLVIDAPAGCPISFLHLQKDALEVRLIDPANASPINRLLADILVAADRAKK